MEHARRFLGCIESMIVAGVIAAATVACSDDGGEGAASGAGSGGGGAGTGGAGTGGAGTGGAGTGGAGTGGAGGSAGATGGAGGATGGAGGGAGAISCAELESQYAAALAEARQCSPQQLSCTSNVDNQLACPCPTFVNSVNQTALETLKSLQKAWAEEGCAAGVQCPLTPCPQPKSGKCEKTPTVVRCVDQN